MAHDLDWPEEYHAVLDQFFSSPRPMFLLSNRLWNPPTDIYERCQSVVIKMEIAGLTLQNVSITAHDRKLIVRGRRCEDKPDAIESYHLMEVRYGEFERVFEFPFMMSSDQIKASYDKGFLCIEVPKSATANVSVSVHVLDNPDAPA